MTTVRGLVEEEGKKVILFVPTISGRNGANKMAKEVKDLNPTVLHSGTYEKVKDELDKQDNKLIITTNIAECGINLDADAVVDTCEQYTFLYNGGIVEGSTMPITKASQIQRRGRIGRKRMGEYFYVKEPELEFRVDSSASFDAEIILRSMEWYDKRDLHETLPMLSKGQIMASLDNNISPLMAWLKFDQNGKRRYGDDKTYTLSDWMKGRVKIDKCMNDKKRCDCVGEYQWWDNRYHDELVDLKMGGSGEPPGPITRSKANISWRAKLGID